MDYARRGSEQDGAVVGGAYEPGAAERQASQSGWVKDRSVGSGAEDRVAGAGYFDGVGADPAGGGALADAVAWIDGHLPVGQGVACQGSLGLVVGPSGEGAGSVTLTNLGDGWVEVDASVTFGAGLPGMVGGEIGRTGGKFGGELGASTTARRRFRVPVLQLGDAEVRLGLFGSLLAQSTGVEAGLRALGLLLRGQDLNPYLLEESYAISGAAQVDAALGALGEEISWLLKDTVGATVGVAWDDLPDDRGHREGTLSLGGTGTVLHQVALQLEQVAGVDVEVPLPALSASGTLVIPITDDLGTITFGSPSVRVAFGGAVASGAAEVGVAVGPDHAAVDAKVARSLQDAESRAAVDALTKVINLGTNGFADVDGARSTVTLGLSVPIDRDLLAAGGATAQDVATYLFTGQVPPALAAVRGLLDAAVAAGKVTVGVDLTLISASVDVSLEGGAVGKLGGSVSASASRVFQDDDVSGLLPDCPTAADVLAALRSGAPSA